MFPKIIHATKLLRKTRPGDAAYDLQALTDNIIPPGTWTTVDTGLKIKLPVGYCGLVLPRSGLAARHGVTVLNSPGLIDENYRGIIGVILINHSTVPYQVKAGDRIAQLLVMKVSLTEFRFGTITDDTVRGSQGFGSSGS